MEKNCKKCNKLFLKNPKYSKKQWEKSSFCSVGCSMSTRQSIKVQDPEYIEFLRKIATGRKQSEEIKIKRGVYRIGSDNPKWKGGITFDGKYLKINRIGKRFHRHIMEQQIGRKLEFNEVVHHIDGNKLNNNINNLVIMSRSNHVALHKPRLGTGKKITYGFRTTI